MCKIPQNLPNKPCEQTPTVYTFAFLSNRSSSLKITNKHNFTLFSAKVHSGGSRISRWGWGTDLRRRHFSAEELPPIGERGTGSANGTAYIQCFTSLAMYISFLDIGVTCTLLELEMDMMLNKIDLRFAM